MSGNAGNGKTLAMHTTREVAAVIRAIADKNGRPISQELRAAVEHWAEREGYRIDIPETASLVAPGICLECGHKKITWSPDAIIRAARLWTERYGSPPKCGDWERATFEFPSHTTVEHRFGYWNNMLLAAGLPMRQRKGQPLRWTKNAIANAMLDWRVSRGEWPRAWQWERARFRGSDFPATSTVRRVFGDPNSWNKAKLYAGWNGVQDLKKRDPEAVAA